MPPHAQPRFIQHLAKRMPLLAKHVLCLRPSLMASDGLACSYGLYVLRLPSFFWARPPTVWQVNPRPL